ncbi:MAG: hypothetical protein Q4A60_06230 [Pasteurellaceae bacterium]|nr:hypothetical protein [Pasteurellaceae bacterium]
MKTFPQITSKIERDELTAYFAKRIAEYQQDLSTEGLSSQQYDILRGRIKELME